jgi:hypothetical protein
LEGNRSTEKQHILGQHLIWVALDNLNVGTGPYTMSFGFNQEPLCDSIRRIGLVNPPCIAKDQDGQIEIVTGYRRILALKQLGWVKVGCGDLTSSLPSASERLLFAFYENLASRTFNPVEKAMVLACFTPSTSTHDLLIWKATSRRPWSAVVFLSRLPRSSSTWSRSPGSAYSAGSLIYH